MLPRAPNPWFLSYFVRAGVRPRMLPPKKHSFNDFQAKAPKRLEGTLGLPTCVTFTYHQGSAPEFHDIQTRTICNLYAHGVRDIKAVDHRPLLDCTGHEHCVCPFRVAALLGASRRGIRRTWQIWTGSCWLERGKGIHISKVRPFLSMMPATLCMT